MPQYFTFQGFSPLSGAPQRLIAYAPDAAQAASRIRQWLASNPYGLGATDLADNLRTWDSTSHSATVSGTQPSSQGGDVRLDDPGSATPDQPAGTGVVTQSNYLGSHNPVGQYTQFGQGGGGTMPRQQALDELGQFRGQFYNKFGIPAYGASPFQAWQEEQYAPTLAAFKLGSAANPDQTFEDYLGTPDVLMGARRQLSQGYENLLGGSDQGAPAQAREAIGEDAWRELLGARLRARRGQFFGRSLARRLPTLEEQYEASPEGFEAPGTYGFMRNILQRRFGI